MRRVRDRCSSDLWKDLKPALCPAAGLHASSVFEISLFEILDDVLNAPKFLRVFIRNCDSKLFFQTEHEPNLVEGISAEILDDARMVRNVRLVYRELLGDESSYARRNSRIDAGLLADGGGWRGSSRARRLISRGDRRRRRAAGGSRRAR